MKKLMTIIGTVLFASVIMIGCGGIERDAKKLAKIECKGNKLMEKAEAAEAAKDLAEYESLKEEFNELKSEASTLSKEIREKYTSEADQKKFVEAYNKEKNNCK